MSTRRSLAYAAGGLGAAAATALAAGAVVERRVVRARRSGAAEADRMGELRSEAVAVTASDGVVLHVEVDELAPYSPAAPGRHRRATPAAPAAPTLVFVHGYALNLDCWHFQREALRGKYRMVFYDQRSHGRSTRSDRERATIDQLGDDLATVLADVVPEGPVVLVGHSMGGMSVIAFAERHREVFDERVVGAALIATTAGGLHPHRTVSRWIPDTLGEAVAPWLFATLAKAPEVIDSARSGSNLGFLVADRFAFGAGDVPAGEVEFLSEMLASTPFEVLADFFPALATLDKFSALEPFAHVPTTVIGATKDRVTPIGHSRKLVGAIPGSRLVVCDGAGHMLLFESRDQVNRALEELVERSTRRPAQVPSP